MYKIELPKRVDKAIAKLDKPLRQKVKEELKKIANNPLLSDPLTGEFKGLWAYHLSKVIFILKPFITM